MASHPHIISLFRPQAPGEPVESVGAVNVIADHGFEGDRKGKSGSKRQVLLMDIETITEFGFVPGDLEENITTEGFGVRELKRGQLIRIGDVVLEVTIERPTCHKIDALRPGLGEELSGRRGKMTRVVSGGAIKVGDVIRTTDD